MPSATMKSVWEEFYKNNNIDTAIPEEIADSWKRSKAAGVDLKKLDSKNCFFTEKQLQQAIERNSQLLDIVRPVMAELCEQFRSQQLIVTIVDMDMCVLDVQRSDKTEPCATLRLSNQPGFCYSEDKVGTTAISLCMQTQHTEIIHKYEHYCEEYHDLFCVATPIFDSDGNICAVLGTSGLDENRTRNLRAVLSIAGRLITNIIKMHGVQEELRRQSQLHGLIVDAASDGLLSVDMDGIITFINPAAMRILGMDKSCIGTHITNALDYEPTILDVVRTRKGYVDREYRLESRGRMVHFIKTAIPMKDADGEMIGVLDIFRSISQVKSMVSKMAGLTAKYVTEDIIGESEPIRNMKKMIRLASQADSPVLIQGESGSGKEMIAQAIHNIGARGAGPFVPINCAAIPRDLIESELFGYEDGAFSGACKGGRPGKFEMAHGGTLFLDEIGDMPLDLQSKMLRVLQQKSVVRVGGFQEMAVDVRIISATNKNLAKMIRAKDFRQDLLYRIDVISITSPPLRERGDDINLLIDKILSKQNLVNGTTKSITPEAREILQHWSWPGNVRELENALEYAYCMAENASLILPNNLPSRFFQVDPESLQGGEVMSLEEAEAKAVVAALGSTDWNLTRASKILGVGRNTLYAKIKKLGLQAPSQ